MAAPYFSSTSIGNAFANIGRAMTPSASDVNALARARYLASMMPYEIAEAEAAAEANRALAASRAADEAATVAQTTARRGIGDIMLGTLPSEGVPEFGPEVPSGPVGTVVTPGMPIGEAFARMAAEGASAGLDSGELESLTRTLMLSRPSSEMSADMLRRFNAIYGDPVGANEAVTAEELAGFQAAARAEAEAVQRLKNEAPMSVAGGSSVFDPVGSRFVGTAPEVVVTDPGEAITVVGPPGSRGIGDLVSETLRAADPAAARAAGSGSTRREPVETLASTGRLEDRIALIMSDMGVEDFDPDEPGMVLNDVTQRARDYMKEGVSEADAPMLAIRDFVRTAVEAPTELFGISVPGTGGSEVSVLRPAPLALDVPRGTTPPAAPARPAAQEPDGSTPEKAFRPTTQKEYDAIPAGKYFVDTDGTIAKKG